MKEMSQGQKLLHEIAMSEEKTASFYRGLHTYRVTWWAAMVLAFVFGVIVGKIVG